MKILYVSSEAAPFAKSGGLGDVAQALPCELAKYDDVDIRVIMPYYKSIKDNANFNIEFLTSFGVNLSWRTMHVGVFKAVFKGVIYYFIDNEYYFYRDGLYGYYDDGERFAYFCRAVIESLSHVDFFPDVIHLNDWQTALIPLYLKYVYHYENIRTVFTIHNIEYQGKMPNEFMTDVIGVGEEMRGTLSYDGCINFMKCAIELSDKVTTVSRTYSFEIRHAYFAHGLENVLRNNEYKLSGIINGIDQDIFSPETDKNIYINYNADNIEKKKDNKIYLRKKLGLPLDPDVPIVAMITRLVKHKGLELVEYMSDSLLNMNLQFVVLGTGDKRYEDLFNYLSYVRPDKMSSNIFFDPTFASEVYAGADFLLMPSKSEPCGLSQLIAMRYGTIPIVNETGGLVDTVPPINTESLEGKGFTFKIFNAHDMIGAVKRAEEFYYQKDKMQKVIKNIMKDDYSWKKPAGEYLSLYKSICY